MMWAHDIVENIRDLTEARGNWSLQDFSRVPPTKFRGERGSVVYRYTPPGADEEYELSADQVGYFRAAEGGDPPSEARIWVLRIDDRIKATRTTFGDAQTKAYLHYKQTVLQKDLPGPARAHRR